MVMEKAYVEELLGVFAETWERKLSLTSAVMASKLAPVAGGASIDDKNDERQPSLESIDEDDVVNGVRATARIPPADGGIRTISCGGR
jgi:hypothetical protein